MLNTQQNRLATDENRSLLGRNINRSEDDEGIKQRAIKMGIELNKQRMEAVNFVLDFYSHCDDCKNARQLMNIMDQEFADKGGKKYLYKLFPAGPLSQIHELTNLPNLNFQVDKGFGTSY